MTKGVFVTNEQVRLTGSRNVALFLAQCLYWSGIDIVKQRQGWFYKSRTEWQEEIWLSRYQQEKARSSLREMGLLEEKRERRNTGIRIWFRLNTGLYYALLNKLSEQTVNNPVELYDNSLSEQSETNEADCMDNDLTPTDSKCVDNNKTIVPETGVKESFMPENGTLVLDNNDIYNDKYSDNHCIDNDVEIIDSEEADASPLSRDLSDCSDNKFSTDPQDYLYCHPFIYCFFKYCQNETAAGHIPGSVQEQLSRFGLLHFDNQQMLHNYIERYGQAILHWYRQNAPVEINPLTRDDIDDAIRASRSV